MSLAQRIRRARYSLPLPVLVLIVVLTTLATHRSMDDALILILAISVAYVPVLAIITRRWSLLRLMLLPSSIIGILGLAIGLRGPDAHGRIDSALDIAMTVSCGCLIAAGFWLRWKDRQMKKHTA